MVSNTFITTTPYNCFPNQFDVYIIENGSSIINLPDHSKQLNIITFSNISNNTISFNGSIIGSTVSLLPQSEVSFTPERTTGYYVVTFSNQPPSNQNWLTKGNTGLVNGVLGTTDSNNFNLINNNTAIATVESNDINMLTHKIVNVGNPTNSQDVSTKIYTDLLGIGYNYLKSGFNTPGWTRIFTIAGTEGSVIQIYITQKNTSSMGGQVAHIELNRRYNGNYSYMLYPGSSSGMNIAVNYSEIWCAPTSTTAQSELVVNCIVNSNSADSGLFTTLTLDGVTNQPLTSPPTGVIDMSRGSQMDINNHNIINLSNPIQPQDAVTRFYADNLPKGGPLLPNTQYSTSTGTPITDIGGFTPIATAGSYGANNGEFIWGNIVADYNDGFAAFSFWGPPTATGSFVGLVFPPGAMWRICAIAIGVRGTSGGQTMNSFTLQDSSNVVFYSNSVAQAPASTKYYSFPFSNLTSSIRIFANFSAQNFSGFVYCQIYGTVT